MAAGVVGVAGINFTKQSVPQMSTSVQIPNLSPSQVEIEDDQQPKIANLSADEVEIEGEAAPKSPTQPQGRPAESAQPKPLRSGVAKPLQPGTPEWFASVAPHANPETLKNISAYPEFHTEKPAAPPSIYPPASAIIKPLSGVGPSTNPFDYQMSPAQRAAAEQTSPVPQGAMPALATGEKYLVRPFEKAAEFGSHVGAEALKSGIADPLFRRSTTISGVPIPGKHEEVVKQFEQEHPRAAGVAAGIGSTVGGVAADPRMWPFFFAAPEAAAGRGFLSRAASPALQKAATVGFTTQMAAGTVSQAEVVKEIWNRPDVPLEQKYETITNLVLSAIMTAEGVRHATRAEAPPELDAQLAAQISQLGEQAKQEIFNRIQQKVEGERTAQNTQAGIATLRPDQAEIEQPAPAPVAKPVKFSEGAAVQEISGPVRGGNVRTLEIDGKKYAFDIRKVNAQQVRDAAANGELWKLTGAKPPAEAQQRVEQEIRGEENKQPEATVGGAAAEKSTPGSSAASSEEGVLRIPRKAEEKAAAPPNSRIPTLTPDQVEIEEPRGQSRIAPDSSAGLRLAELRQNMRSAKTDQERGQIQEAIDREIAMAQGQAGKPLTPHPAIAEGLTVRGEETPMTEQERKDIEASKRARGENVAKTAANLNPGETAELSPRELSFDPARFQYKANTNEKGVTSQFAGGKFNPDLAGIVSVWRDPADGKVYVINGHHRAQLALESGADNILVRHLDVPNAKSARARGALQNIAEGRGTAVDAAKFLRDSGFTAKDLEKHGIALTEATASKGLALSKLDPSIFEKVATGKISEGRGIAIGGATEDPAQQEAIVKLIDKREGQGKNVTDATVAQLARFVANSGNRTVDQGGLFGANNQIHSLALEKAEISAYIKQQIGKERRAFAAVASEERAQALGRVEGQQIKAEENRKISDAAKQAEELYNRLSSRSGPVNDVLEAAARELTSGNHRPEEVKQRAYSAIRDEVRKTLGEGEGRGPEGPKESSGGGAPASPEEPLYSVERPAPTFFSKAEKTAEEKLPKNVSAQSVISTLKNAGVKDEEIKWMGLEDWLKGKGLIPKQELLDFMRENNVQVREVEKGGGGKYVLDSQGRRIYDNAGGFIERRDGTKFEDYQLPGGENYRELLLTLPKRPFNDVDIPGRGIVETANFRSSHFDEPNVLAHVRFNDRVDADGKKVLFLEEVQSDWHQKGRREGYQPDRSSPPGWSTPNDSRAQGKGVPDAPFKSTWHELALKRMLRYAAENGYDKVAWTTGEQQAERYDLSKQVDEIHYRRNADGTYDIYAAKDGEPAAFGPEMVNLKPERLPDVVGKELADKIHTATAKEGKFTGQDLKVGGQGMKGFYDKIIPDFLNKYGKKWGARVEETTLTRPRETTIENTGNPGPGAFVVTNRGGSTWYFGTREEAEAKAAALDDKDRIGVHSIPVTPSMKDSVLYEGQPLFNLSRPELLSWAKNAGSKIKVEPMGDQGNLFRGTGEKMYRLSTSKQNSITATEEQLRDLAGQVPSLAKQLDRQDIVVDNSIRFDYQPPEAASLFGGQKPPILTISRGARDLLVDKAGTVRFNAANMSVAQARSIADKLEAMPAEKGAGPSPSATPEGQQADTFTPEFKEWFSGSKVADPAGNPLTVYHGTNQAFDNFGNDRGAASVRRHAIGTESQSNHAHWFVENKRVAEYFANGGLTPPGVLYEGSRVIPANLSLKNPLIVDMNSIPLDAQAKQWSQTASDTGKVVHEIGFIKEKALRDARRNGNDGVIFKNGYDKRPYSGDIYAVFDSGQIKATSDTTSRPQSGGSATPEAVQLAQALRKAADDAGNSGITIHKENAPQKVIEEEQVHAGQRQLGGGEVTEHLSNDAMNRVLAHPATNHFLSDLQEQGYTGLSKSHKVVEIAAHIATGQHSLSPEKAADWFVRYVDELHKEHGQGNVATAFANMYDEAQEHYERARQTLEERAARQGGRESGLQQPGAGIPEHPTGTAPPEARGRNRQGSKENQGSLEQPFLLSRERQESQRGSSSPAALPIPAILSGANWLVKKGADWYHSKIDDLLNFVRMGETRPEIRKYDEAAADLATKVDAAGQYHKKVAENIAKTITGPLTEEFKPEDNYSERQKKNEISRDRMKGFHFLADAQNREWLEKNKPDDFKRWSADPKIADAIKEYKPYMDDLRNGVKQLGGKTIDEDYIKRVLDFATSGIDRPEATGARKAGAGRDNVISPQIDRSKARKDDGQFYWDHGVFDFGPSFEKRWVEVMSKLDEHRLAVHAMSMGTRIAPGEESPEKIFYNGQEFYRPDVAQEIKEVQKRGVSAESKQLADALGVSELPTPKDARAYDVYEPVKRGSRFENAAQGLASSVIDSEERASGTKLTTQDRDSQLAQAFNLKRMAGLKYALPKEIVKALTDAAREKEQGALGQRIRQVIAPLTQFIRQQIVGLAYGVPHMANILRKIVQAHPGAALNPMAWVDGFRVAFSKELKARAISGTEDPAFDRLLRNAAISDAAIPDYKHYIEGNLDRENWTSTLGNAFRQGGREGGKITPLSAAAGLGRLAVEPLNRFSEAGHHNLFKAGGIDQRARLWMYDFLKDRFPGISDEKVAHEVNQALGRYNRASWTSVQKDLAPFMLFPGWDYSSMAYALKHPFKTAIAPAVIIMLANAAVRAIGGQQKRDDKYDTQNIHLGKYRVRTNLLNDNLGSHLWGWALRGVSSVMEGKSKKEVLGQITSGIPGDVARMSTGMMNPVISTPIQLGANRVAPGTSQEIIKQGDTKKRGSVLPNKAAEDVAQFGAERLFPLWERVHQDGHPSLPALGGLVGVNVGKEEKKRRR